MISHDLIKGANGVVQEMGGVINRRQVYHMVEHGRLPVIRKGKSMYFRRSELDSAFRGEASVPTNDA